MPNNGQHNTDGPRVAANISLVTDYVSLSAPGISASAASSSSNTISLDTPSTGADSYQLQFSTDQINWTTLDANLLSGEFPYTHSGLSASTTYYYRALAQNANGSSGYGTANATTSAEGGSSPGFASFTSHAFVANTTTNCPGISVPVTLDRHPGWDATVGADLSCKVVAYDGFDGNGRYTALSETVTWTGTDCSDKTVNLNIPAQTINGFFEVVLKLEVETQGQANPYRKVVESYCRVRVDTGTARTGTGVYHVDPDNVNAADTPSNGTAADPCLTMTYLLDTVLGSDPGGDVIVYMHPATNKYGGEASWDVNFDGTEASPFKIEPMPGTEVNIAESSSFRLERHDWVHLGSPVPGSRIRLDTDSTGAFHNTIHIRSLGGGDYKVGTVVDNIIGRNANQATGGDNVPYVYFHTARDCVARNCDLVGNKITSDGSYNQNLPCIESYYSANCLIEQCYTNDANSGIYLKLPATFGNAGLASFVIRRNMQGPLCSYWMHLNSNESMEDTLFEQVTYNNLCLASTPVYSISGDQVNHYEAGTVTANNGGLVVTGSGTAWLANVSAGDTLVVNGDPPASKIASVDSDTQITLEEPYAGDSYAGSTYWINTVPFWNNILFYNNTFVQCNEFMARCMGFKFFDNVVDNTNAQALRVMNYGSEVHSTTLEFAKSNVYTQGGYAFADKDNNQLARTLAQIQAAVAADFYWLAQDNPEADSVNQTPVWVDAPGGNYRLSNQPAAGFGVRGQGAGYYRSVGVAV